MSKKNITEVSCAAVYKKKSIAGVFARIGIVLLTTVILLVAVVYAAGFVLFKGPSPTMRNLLTLTLRETSAMYWVPNLFLSEEEVNSIAAPKAEDAASAVTNVSLITIGASGSLEQTTGGINTSGTSDTTDNTADVDPDGDGIDIIEINSGNYKGFLAIIYDPSRVILGTSRDAKGDTTFKGEGIELTGLCEEYNAVLGINAGGFEDANGGGSGGIPIGLVIENGQLTYGKTGTTYCMVGIDSNGILHVGNMTGAQAHDADIQWACSFEPALIINGEPQQHNLVSGVNPRTAIGQRADGAILMLVIDGRQIESLGATYEDLIEIMLEYGAVNAFNLDGGSSTMMVYNGEILNSCASVYGPRPLPTAFLVLPLDDTGE